jgi:hypothetical protein
MSPALCLIAILVVLSIAQPLPAAPSGLPAPTQITLSGKPIMHSAPGVADFNGDGTKEIIVGGTDGMLYVLSLVNSTWQPVWSRQTALDLNAAGAPTGSPCVSNQSDIESAPAVADLDNDGKLEIVVTTGGDIGNHRNGGVLVYRFKKDTPHWEFTLVPGWPQPKLDAVGGGNGNGFPDGCWDGIWSTPALGDLDGDGDLEIVFEGFDRRIHAYHHDGQVVNGWPIYRYNGDALLRGGWSSPALGDIDHDGLPEVIVGTDSPMWGGEGSPNPTYDNGTVWAINGDSSNVPGWPVRIAQTVQSSVALGDINNDGNLEIIVGTGTGYSGSNGYKVYAFQSNGTALPNWPRSTTGNVTGSPALADLDNDGKLDVIVGCGTEGDPYTNPPCTKLYAWRADGSNLPGFPMVPTYNNPGGGTPIGLPYGPVVADYTGDGMLDILVLSRFSWGLSTVKANGQDITDPALRAEQSLYSTPLVDDIDGDGYLEIVVAGPNASYTNAAVLIWQTTEDTNRERPWPMFHRNMLRDGLYPISTPVIVFPKVFVPLATNNR